MSIKLAKDEKILKDYAYAQVNTKKGMKKTETSKNLIVTNKRVIHREVFHQFGGENITNEQIYLSNIKTVDVSYGIKRNTAYLILAVLCFLATLFIVPRVMSSGEANMAIILIPLVFGIIFTLLYIFIKNSALTCILGHNSEVDDYMALGIAAINFVSGSRKKSKKKTKIQILIDTAVAKEITEEIGAIILDAANGVYDEKAEG